MRKREVGMRVRGGGGLEKETKTTPGTEKAGCWRGLCMRLERRGGGFGGIVGVGDVRGCAVVLVRV